MTRNLFLLVSLYLLTTAYSFQFFVIDIATGKAVRSLQQGYKLCAANYPSGFSIEAVPAEPVDNVYFSIKEWNHQRREWYSPYTLNGDDREGDIRPWKMGNWRKGQFNIVVEALKGDEVVEEGSLLGTLTCEGVEENLAVPSPDVVRVEVDDDF